ncbi:hypothetical protein SUGI_0775450 [Cryptomeria japonica]|nr:hypothetical protein SUGI_0775450 [Cryptomeria japonica]
MDTDDIITALRQASELHAKINHAMERVSAYGREISTGGTAIVINGVNGSCMDEDINHLSPEEAMAMEARSLASIGDSLDVLQDQLYCLQILLDQQQADKKAALSDMEEIRKILLSRLRKHRGREWAVVQEALAFVGEPVEEQDAIKYCCVQDPQCHPLIKSLTWIEEKKEESFSEIQGCPTHKKEPSIKNDQIESKGFLKSLCNNLSNSMGSAVSLAAKTALVAAGILTLLAVSKMGKNKLKNPSFPTDKKIPLMEESCQPNYEGVLIKSSASLS